MTFPIPSFPRLVKRDHRVYDNDTIAPILDYLSQEVLPWGYLPKISKDTGIPKQTLSDWRRHRRSPEGRDWFPLANGHPNKRIFSETQEEAIADYLKTNMINPGYGPVRSDIKTVASNAYSSQEISEFRHERFCASDGFVTNFMNRWNLGMRTPHAERRTDIDPDIADVFSNRLNDCKKDYPNERIYNFDETCWHIYMGPQKVIAEKGTETVKLRCRTGEKLSVTAFGTISASGDKLPLWVVTKGRTSRSLSKFGDHEGAVFKFSESGWATENLILEYLGWLSEQSSGEPCILIMDVYPTHRTERVREAAMSLNIEILYVPAGGTSQFQPLDARIFGELKSRARAQFQRLSASEGVRGASYAQSIAILLDCWEKIAGENIQQAWSVVGFENDD
jgi:hypothetical protein